MTSLTIVEKLFPGATFRPFTQADWLGFAGCESETPYIAETDNGVVILDGNVVQVLAEVGEDDALGFSYTFTITNPGIL